MLQCTMQALELVLYNRSDTKLLSKFSSVSQELKQAAAEVVKSDFSTLLVAALIKKSWQHSATAPLTWLCKTAGPAVVGSPDVTCAMLAEVGNIDPQVASILARHGECILVYRTSTAMLRWHGIAQAQLHLTQ